MTSGRRVRCFGCQMPIEPIESVSVDETAIDMPSGYGHRFEFDGPGVVRCHRDYCADELVRIYRETTTDTDEKPDGQAKPEPRPIDFDTLLADIYDDIGDNPRGIHRRVAVVMRRRGTPRPSYTDVRDRLVELGLHDRRELLASKLADPDVGPEDVGLSPISDVNDDIRSTMDKYRIRDRPIAPKSKTEVTPTCARIVADGGRVQIVRPRSTTASTDIADTDENGAENSTGNENESEQ